MTRRGRLIPPATSAAPVVSDANSNCQPELTANMPNIRASAQTIVALGSSRDNGPRVFSPRLPSGCPAVCPAAARPVAPVPSMRMMRSASVRASACECEMMSRVTFRFRSSRMSSYTRCLTWSSSPAIGSSMISTSGSHASTPAMATSRCWPHDSSNGDLSARCSMRSSLMARSTRRATCVSSSSRLRGPYAMSSATVGANSWRSGCCMTYPTLARSRLRVVRSMRARSMPSMAISPDSGLSRAHSRRASVVLPEPLCPISATVSPRRMVRLKSSRIFSRDCGYRYDRSRTLTMGSPDASPTVWPRRSGRGRACRSGSVSQVPSFRSCRRRGSSSPFRVPA